MRARRSIAVALLLATPLAAQSTTIVSVDSAGTPGNGPSGDGGRGIAISASGRYIAFHSIASNLVVGDANDVDDVFIHDALSGSTTRVSVGSLGDEADFRSRNPSLSADGRYVAFDSDATNLVGDTNWSTDVFVHDCHTGSTVRASVNSAGIEGNGASGLEGLAISGDGRFVVFSSDASNLVAGDSTSQGHTDIFVHDMQTSDTTCASVTPAGSPGTGEEPSVSADGRYVAFTSFASILVLGDTNGSWDTFVRDRQTGQTTRVSVDSAGTQGNGPSTYSSISADGRFVAFLSSASNLIVGGTSGGKHVFVHDRQSSTTVAVSVSSSGALGNANSFFPAITADGRYVAFESNASNLVVGDTNGADDVFVHDRQTGITTRVSVNDAGQQIGSYSQQGAVSADGRDVAFHSWQAFLRDWWRACYVDGDLDGFGAGPVAFTGPGCGAGFSGNSLDCDDTRSTIYPGAVEVCNGLDDDCDGGVDEGLMQTFYVDIDGDGFGDPFGVLVACAQPNGYVLDSTDCDDSNPAVHPGAIERCNGIDDECNGVIDDGFISAYCTAGTTVHGCVPSITGEGAPSTTSGSGFDIVARNVEGQRMGLIFYGFYPAAVPWAPASPSFRCVSYPVQRTGSSNSGGTLGQCDGELRVDFNAWIAAHPTALGYPFVAGQVFYAQGWFRDSGAPKGTNLSNGLRFTLCD